MRWRLSMTRRLAASKAADALDRLAEPRALAALVTTFLALVVVAVLLAGYAAVSATTAVKAQREGRVIGQRTTCGALNAIIDSGRVVISSGIDLPKDELAAALRRHKLPVERAQRAIALAARSTITGDAFAKALQRYGLPPVATRRAIVEAAADAYARRITDRVIHERGAASVVGKDGLLDCARLRAATGIH